MEPFRVVTEDERTDDLTPEDIQRLEAGLARLRRLLDDPIALMDRARALLEGTAERLI